MDFERSDGNAATVNVPVLQAAVGGKVSMSTEGQQNSRVTFDGPTKLVFGFKCFRVGVKDGFLELMTVKEGKTLLATDEGDDGGDFLDDYGPTDLRD